MINNSTELEFMYMLVISQAVDNAVEKLLQELKEDIRSEGIFNTGQFEESWIKTSPLIKQNIVNCELLQDPFSMSLQQNKFIHGSNYPYPNDVREGLADIIFNGKAGDLFGEGYWRQPRDMWSPTVDKLLNGTVANWILTEIKSKGIDISLA